MTASRGFAGERAAQIQGLGLFQAPLSIWKPQTSSLQTTQASGSGVLLSAFRDQAYHRATPAGHHRPPASSSG